MATTLGNTAVGSIVKLKENGVAQNYIVVHQGNPSATIYDSSCNGTWLLRQDTIEKRVWDSGNVNKYEESDIHSWLNLVMLAKYDADIQSAIKQVKIPYRHGGGTGGIDQHGANGLSTKPFLLSSREIGLTLSDSVDGSKLEYFLYADSLEARVKRQANTNWWLRSLYTSETSYVYIIDSNGPYGGSLTNGKVGVRPVIILPPTLIANDDGSIITNTAPSVPSSISVPSTITDGDTITVSWGASMDLENNLSGYRLEKSTNGGSSWNQIYQGTATSKTDTISGITQVMYRVKAYDALGLESGYKTSSNVSIRFKPSTPGSISIPDEINDGQNITITWTASTDTNSNLAGYRLEKSTDGGTQWAQIYQGSNLSYSEVVVDISQVQYRVKAYDDTNLESGYATTQNILVNRYPTIQADIIDGTNLGVKDVGFTINYTVSDQDANSVTVIEMLDSNELRSYTVTLGEQNTFDVSGLTFMKLSNGEHTLQIIANDGKVSTTFTVYFTKEVTSASVTLETAMTKPGKIMVCNLTVEGSISADALFRVEVSNNANDTSPVWEDCTTAVRNGVNYVFFNKTAEAGFAFNFKVAVKRGDSNTGGYITKVSGKFA